MEYIRETFFDRRCNEIEQKVRLEAKKETIREVKKAKREAKKEIIREVKKAKLEAEEEKTNVILRMLKMINSSEEIHQLTGFPLSQINDIRNEHSL